MATPISKLNDFYQAPDETTNLVIIPSGYVMGKPPAEYFNETEQLSRLKQNHISITLPYDNNIYNGKFSKISWGEEISHSPQERAEMIYEAITAQNSDGQYKYNNLYFTGGSNTEDVIFELEKICRAKGALPQRNNDLKTYGFSDATQLHHYLGQRGISTPVYYSKNVYALIKDLSENNHTTSLNIEALNDAAQKTNEINGHLQPGNQAQVENRTTHQTRFFQEGYNFLVVEFRNKAAAEAFLQTSKNFKKEKIALLLSKDTHKEATEYFMQNTDFPVFSGMPVGHGDCQKNGEGLGISLFSSAKIRKTDNGYNLEFKEKAADNIYNLLKNETRSPLRTRGGNAENAILENINGSAGAVFKNLEDIQIGSTSLTIDIQRAEHNLTQAMEISVKTLIERKIIDPKTLKTLNFRSSSKDVKMKNTIQHRMNDLRKRYLPNLKEMKLNETFIFNNSNSKIDQLRGLSTPTETPCTPQTRINTLKLKQYQSQK